MAEKKGKIQISPGLQQLWRRKIPNFSWFVATGISTRLQHSWEWEIRLLGFIPGFVSQQIMTDAPFFPGSVSLCLLRVAQNNCRILQYSRIPPEINPNPDILGFLQELREGIDRIPQASFRNSSQHPQNPLRPERISLPFSTRKR